MKGKIILGSLIVLFIALAVPNVSATYDVCTACHPSYVDAIRASGHANSDNCINCHKAGYDTSDHQDSTPYIGYNVTEATCTTSYCHSPTGVGRPVNESHGNKYYGPNKADCTQCHFANTTKTFTGYNTSLYTHDHNLTVEYNFYNYNLYGMPLESDHSASKKGMFPYYTCTLTCHSTYKIESEVIGWNESKHARSREGTSDSNAYCAKCKSPTQYNTSADQVYNASANRSEFPIAEANWQGIQCRICHNLHNDTYSGANAPAFPLAYYNPLLSYNASRPVYDQVSDATVLCQKCHSNRNFAGVHKDTVGFDCANCHANSTYSDRTHNFEVKNTTSGVEGCDVCHNPADHTWEQTSKHTNVECWACHDQTIVYNATSGNATSPGNTFGIWNDPSTGNWTTYKVSHDAPAKWILHNITKSVSCDKCHIGNSTYNGTIGPGLTCSGCHSSYANAVNASKHNQTLYSGAPANCTVCHSGYLPSYGHTTGNRSYIVNESNTCRTCHIQNVNLNESHGNKYYGPNKADCTQCHFANTTQSFSLNASLYTHDHNLTVEYNFYNYNLYGMPLESDHSASKKGMFPYYTCTLTCHSTYKIESEVIGWNESKHARSREGTSDSNAYCAKCKSPTQYNTSADTTYNASANRSEFPIAEANWQGIQCRICHNLHNDTYSGASAPAFPLAYYNPLLSYNASRPVYDQVSNATVLCEKCHSGNNGRNYAGFHKDTLGFDCANCHANSTFNSATHLFDVKNTTTGVTGCEVCHQANAHTFEFTANHTGKVTCDACHDKTVSRNATGYAYSSFGTSKKAGLYVDPANGNVSSWMGSVTSPATWPLHNISKDVSCNKCHGTKSAITDSLLAPTFGTIGCVKCHPSYASAVNNSMHNKTANTAAPNCTDCHKDYDTSHTGYTGYIVNESNTCRNCHVEGVNLSESHGNHNYGQNYTDCTQCHFANTTQQFSLNSSFYTHDHNLTVEYNFYNYNLYGMPLESDHSASKKGMFPYYTCTLTCHNGTGSGQPKIEDEVISWELSKHARSYEGQGDNNAYCAKCKSPTQYSNSSNARNMTIDPSNWQGIQCRICHNLHNDTYSGNGTPPINISFYNTTATLSAGSVVYDNISNSTVLCQKCHSNRDFAGVHKDTVGFECTDCHANSTFNDETHLFEVKNTTSGKTGCEVCHDATSAHSNFIEYSIHTSIVTCEACHVKTVAKNSSDFVVSVISGLNAGLYKESSTNKWITYKDSHGAPATWNFHNISRSIDCYECHGARSVYNGSIAPNLTSGGTTYYTTDTLVSGYNLILLLLNPNPTLYAGNLLYTSSIGIPGVTKVLKWDSANQTWASYQYIVTSSGDAFYYPTNGNFTMDGYKAYFIKGNATTAGRTYTFVGTK